MPALHCKHLETGDNTEQKVEDAMETNQNENMETHFPLQGPNYTERNGSKASKALLKHLIFLIWVMVSNHNSLGDQCFIRKAIWWLKKWNISNNMHFIKNRIHQNAYFEVV